MKKVLLIFLVLIISVSVFSASNNKPSLTKTEQAFVERHNLSIDEYAQLLGFNHYPKYYSTCKTEEEALESIAYTFIKNKLDYTGETPICKITDKAAKRFNWTLGTEKWKQAFGIKELLGLFANISYLGFNKNEVKLNNQNLTFKRADKNGRISITKKQATMYYENTFAAMDRAFEIIDYLKRKGTITDEMTDYEKVSALCSYIMPSGNHIDGDNTPMADSAYGVLYNNLSCCVGRSAAMVMLLRILHIPCTTLGVHPRVDGKAYNQNHQVTHTFLDGQEYIVDWQNKRYLKILTIKEAEKDYSHFYNIDISTDMIKRCSEPN